MEKTDFIDLEDAQPKGKGIYEVKIKTTVGRDRICKADWIPGKGFYPIAERLLPEEYIYAWRNN